MLLPGKGFLAVGDSQKAVESTSVVFKAQLVREPSASVPERATSMRAVHDSATVERLVELSLQGRVEEAMRGLEALLVLRPGDADAAAALWNTASRANVPSRAVPAVLPAVEAAVRAGDVGLPAQIWAELVRQSPEAEVDLRMATRAAELLMREGMHGDVETTLHWLTGRVDSSTPEGLLVRLARLAHRLNMPTHQVARR